MHSHQTFDRGHALDSNPIGSSHLLHQGNQGSSEPRMENPGQENCRYSVLDQREGDLNLDLAEGNPKVKKVNKGASFLLKGDKNATSIYSASPWSSISLSSKPSLQPPMKSWNHFSHS